MHLDFKVIFDPLNGKLSCTNSSWLKFQRVRKLQDDLAAAAPSRKEEQERFLLLLIINQRFTHKKSPFICHFELNIKHLLVLNSLLLSGTYVETI